jgi:hypothetical protein
MHRKEWNPFLGEGLSGIRADLRMSGERENFGDDLRASYFKI